MRIRTIKPEFWSHPVMARLDDMVQLLALALLSAADDHGYFRADTAIVRGACMPFREDLASISDALVKLSEVGWIEVSFHPKQGPIGRIANWTSHQKVDHPSASKIKAYFSDADIAKVSREPREKLALDQGSGNREQGEDQGGGQAAAQPVEKEMDPDDQIRPLAAWVRWQTKETDRTADNRAELLALVQRYGRKAVQSAAEALSHSKASKVWPNELSSVLVAATGQESSSARLARYRQAWKSVETDKVALLGRPWWNAHREALAAKELPDDVRAAILGEGAA